jgi:hypothetical protein
MSSSVTLPASSFPRILPFPLRIDFEELYPDISKALENFPIPLIEGVKLFDLAIISYLFSLVDYSKDIKMQEMIREGIVHFLYETEPYFLQRKMIEIDRNLKIESKGKQAFLSLIPMAHCFVGDNYIISKKTCPSLAIKIEKDDNIAARRATFFRVIRAIGIYAHPHLSEPLKKELKDLEMEGILGAKSMNPSELMDYFKRYTACSIRIYNYLDDEKIHIAKAFPFFQRILSYYFEEDSFQIFLKCAKIPLFPDASILDNYLLGWVKLLSNAHGSLDKETKKREEIVDVLVKLSFSFQYPMLLELVKKDAPRDIYENLAVLKSLAWKNLTPVTFEESSPYNISMLIDLSFDFCLVIKSITQRWHKETVGLMGFIGLALPKDYMKIRDEIDSRFHALQNSREVLKNRFLFSKEIFDFLNFSYFGSLTSLEILTSDETRMKFQLRKQCITTIELVTQLTRFTPVISHIGGILSSKISNSFHFMGGLGLQETRPPLDLKGASKKKLPILTLPSFKKIGDEAKIKFFGSLYSLDLSHAFLFSLQKYENAFILFNSLLLDAEPNLYRALCIHLIRSMTESLELVMMIGQDKKDPEIRSLQLLMDDPLDEDNAFICFLDPVFMPKDFSYTRAVSYYDASEKPAILELVNLPKSESVSKMLILSEKVLDILYAYMQEDDFEIEESSEKIQTSLFEVDGSVEEVEPIASCPLPSEMRYMAIRNYLRSQISLKNPAQDNKIKDTIDSLDICQQLLELILRKNLKDPLVLEFFLKSQEDLIFKASMLKRFVRESCFLPLEKETFSREMVQMPPLLRHRKVLEKVVSYCSSPSK